MTGRVVAVNLAHVGVTPGDGGDVKPALTGIDKRPVPGPVRIEPLGLVGDRVMDVENHGGVTQAVYAYASEDQDWWTEELGEELHRPITPGCFGENLTLSGVDVTGARLGERWSIGPVVLEVTAPRIPCSTFAGFMGLPRWVARFARAGRPGAYLRVVTPGDVCAGDLLEVRQAAAAGPTVGEAFAAFYRR